MQLSSINPILLDFNVSNDLANYMTTVYDQSYNSLYHGMVKVDPNYSTSVKNLENQLDNVLLDNNLTLVQLFNKSAIK